MITTAFLNQLPYLKKELTALNRELTRIEHQTTPRVILPRKTEYAAALDELRDTVQQRRDCCAAQIEEMERFLAGIDDPIARPAFFYRYSKGLSWRDTLAALQLDGFPYLEESAVKMMCNRYLERYNRNEQ